MLLRRCAKACRATKNTKRVAAGEADLLEFIYIYIYIQELPPPWLADVALYVITRDHVCPGVLRQRALSRLLRARSPIPLLAQRRTHGSCAAMEQIE